MITQVDIETRPQLPALLRRTTIESCALNIHHILDSIKVNDLIINPRYQRGKVGQYKSIFRTRLIESILIGFPIPSLLVMEMPDGKPQELIDGQQRIRTIEYFMDGDRDNDKKTGFALDGKHLMVLSADDYHGRKWDDLDPAHKNKIRNYKLKVDYIDNTLPPNLVFGMINGGQNTMNSQEARLWRFGEDKKFWCIDDYAREDKWTCHLQSTKRGKGTDTAFKAILSMIYGTKLIPGSQNKWLEAHIQQLFADNSIEQIENILTKFDSVMKTSREVFGEYPFGMPGNSRSKVKNPIIMMTPFIINKIIEEYNIKTAVSNATLLRTIFEDYCNEHANSGYSVDGLSVTTRNNELWTVVHKALIDAGAKSPKRTGGARISKKLSLKVIENYRADGKVECQLCNEVIMDESQISIDHIVRFSKGGATILENLQPTHGSCNSSKR